MVATSTAHERSGRTGQATGDAVRFGAYRLIVRAEAAEAGPAAGPGVDALGVHVQGPWPNDGVGGPIRGVVGDDAGADERWPR